MITHCPKHPEIELIADGDEFIGMPTAGWCPKCRCFYRWSSGERVGAPTAEIEISVDDSPPVKITHRGGLTTAELFQKAKNKLRKRKRALLIKFWLTRFRLLLIQIWSRLKSSS